jgi:hypothetical protein
MKKKLRILVAVAGLTALAFGNNVKAQEVITANDLYFYSLDNEVSFDAKYTKKTVKVRGKVMGEVFKNTKQPWNKGYSVWLGWIGEHYNPLDVTFAPGGGYTSGITRAPEQGVRLFITESNAGQFANVRKGDEITIQGRCIGRGGSLLLESSSNRPDEVFIDNCTLIEINVVQAKIDREEKAKRDEMVHNVFEELRKEEAERQAKEKEKEAREKAAKAAKEKAEREEAERKAREAAEYRRKNGVVECFFWGKKKGGINNEWIKMELDRRPTYSGGQEEGVVRVDVKVQRTRVLKAKLDKKHTTIKDKSIQNSALESARRQTSPFFSSRASWYTFQYKFSK